MPVGTGSVGMVHGVPCVGLDPVHAQRVIRIADAGNQLLIVHGRMPGLRKRCLADGRKG